MATPWSGNNRGLKLDMQPARIKLHAKEHTNNPTSLELGAVYFYTTFILESDHVSFADPALPNDTARQF
jgi:hypothetical protein